MLGVKGLLDRGLGSLDITLVTEHNPKEKRTQRGGLIVARVSLFTERGNGVRVVVGSVSGQSYQPGFQWRKQISISSTHVSAGIRRG